MHHKKILQAMFNLYLTLLVIGLFATLIQISEKATNEDSFYHMWAAGWIATIGSSIFPTCGYNLAIKTGQLLEGFQSGSFSNISTDGYYDMYYNEVGAKIGNTVGNFIFTTIMLLVITLILTDRNFNRWVNKKLKEL